MWQGLSVGVALCGLGALLLGSLRSTVWLVSLIVLGLGIVVCVGTLLDAARQAENRASLRRRSAFWIDLPDGRRQRITYGRIVNLPRSDRARLLARDRAMQTWFQQQFQGENIELSGRLLRAGRVKRLWLRLVLPFRFRDP